MSRSEQPHVCMAHIGVWGVRSHLHALRLRRRPAAQRQAQATTYERDALAPTVVSGNSQYVLAGPTATHDLGSRHHT